MVRVREIMTTDVVVLRGDDSLQEATIRMSRKGNSGVPVIDPEGMIVGILSESDILEFAASYEGHDLDVRSLSLLCLPYERLTRDEEVCQRYRWVGEAKVKEGMNEEVVTIDGEEDVRKALETMVRLGSNRQPVASQGSLIGMVARQDVLVALCRELGKCSPEPATPGR
jgi:CBS domain-containing protein